MTDVGDLWAALAGHAIGAQVSVALIRGGQAAERTVTVGERA